jgi:tetratricopeptide (TPR) repeat protein
MELYSKIDKAKTKNEKASFQSEQKKFFDTSKQELLNAVKVYKRISDSPQFRNYPRMDEALFYYAYTLQGAKYMKEARSVFHRLIKDYPNSKYIPEAYLAFADYYFAENSLANAERFYDKVLKFPKSGVYNYAMYKKGWVYLNLDRPQDALETFFTVAQRTEKSKKEQTLNRASKKDFVRAYAEVGKPQLAYKAFQRVDKDYSFDMLQILGDIYMEQGKAAKAIYTFREMIGLKPKHKQVCEWQGNVVTAMLSVGTEDQKVSEIENLVNLYVKYRDNKVLPDSELGECAENAEALASEMAKLWHNEAIKTLNTDTLVYVERLYRLYLASFPKSKEYAEMQYYYAELKWSRAENEKNQRIATELWEEAAVAFTDVVKSGQLKGKLLKEAAYAAVLGWKNALAVDPRTKAPPPTAEQTDKLPPPQDIPDRELKMIEAFDIYINYIKDPKDDELVMMKFLKARIFWRYNQFDKAIPLFEDIVEKHLSHETGEYAVNLLLDTLNRGKRYNDMLKWVDVLLTKKEFLADKDDLAKRLEGLKRQSLRLAAEEIEKNAKDSGDYSKYVDCGEAYLRIYNRDPEGEKGDEVLYNAGVCFEEGRSIGAAITMYNLLGKRYPDSKSTQKAIARLGNNYARVAWYDQAATKLEEYARRFGGEKDAFKALSDAVFYRKGIGHDDKAIKDTEFFIKQYGTKQVSEAAAAMWSLTAIYEKQGDKDKVISHLRRYLKTYGKKGGVDRQVIAHTKIGMILWEQSCPGKGVDGACIRISRERSIVSKSRRGKKSKRATLPTQCGPESKIKVTVVARDGRKVREAQKEFSQAIRLFGKGSAVKQVPNDDGDQGVRTALMVKYFAAAQFSLAEEQYETFLSIKFPQNLDFDPKNAGKKKNSEKRFMDWYKEKEKLSVKAIKSYKDIIDIKDAQYAISAAARIGQVSQNFSDQLFTAEIPKDVRTGAYAEDKVDAYCDALTTQAEPLEKISVDAFGFCLGLSTQLNWFNEWSRLCEKELGQIRPQEYPTASEIRAEPNNIATVITTEKPTLKLE